MPVEIFGQRKQRLIDDNEIGLETTFSSSRIDSQLINPSPTWRTYNPATIDEAIDLIASLPRRLPENVSVRIPPGTTDRTLLFRGFSGSNIISIFGANAVGEQTRTFGMVFVENCSNADIRLEGLTVNYGDMPFRVSMCTASVRFRMCNSVNAGWAGTQIQHSQNVVLYECMFSNKSTVVAATIGKIFVVNLSGSSNATAYTAFSNSDIRVANEGTLQYAIYGITAQGGQVIDSLGRRIADTPTYIANRIYQGIDLSQRFASEIAGFGGDQWAWIQSRIRRGDYEGINVKDWLPLTVAGQNFQMEVAGLNTYTPQAQNHIDFISRDCWAEPIPWNLVNFNNGLASEPSAFRASNIYAFLNGLATDVPNAETADPETTSVDYTATGIWPQLPAELRNVIVPKVALVPIRYAAGLLLTEDNSWVWSDFGNLWLPTEVEVYGTAKWSINNDNPSNAFGAGGFVQYPIFAGGVMSRIKGLSAHPSAFGGRVGWQLGSATGVPGGVVAGVGHLGHAGHYVASFSGVFAPLCFRVA